LRNTSEDDLTLLSHKKLSLAYIGIESGCDEVLRLLGKGISASETQTAIEKLTRNGWRTSAIIMAGAGGQALSGLHAAASAALVSKTQPRFLSFLVTTPVPGTPYFHMIKHGKIAPLTWQGIFMEMRTMIGGIHLPKGSIIFRANHVSNELPLEGILPRDNEKIISQLNKYISVLPPNLYPSGDHRFL
jgi:radical SAM superfamily enzyme YgiQ (UPF0313 family)